MLLYDVPLSHFVRDLLLPFTKVLGQNDLLQKDFLHKSNEKNLFSELAILAQKRS